MSWQYLFLAIFKTKQNKKQRKFPVNINRKLKIKKNIVLSIGLNKAKKNNSSYVNRSIKNNKSIQFIHRHNTVKTKHLKTSKTKAFNLSFQNQNRVLGNKPK